MKNLIGGRLVDASDGKVIEVTNPATGELIDTVPNATEQDVDTIVSVINQCYDDIRVNRQQLIRYRQTPVYCADLWVLAVSRTENICVGAGIADYDRELGELVLEWIQVLPAYRNRKIGQEIVCELLRRMRGTAKFATVSGQANNPSRPEFLYRKCGFTGTDVWHVLSAK